MQETKVLCFQNENQVNDQKSFMTKLDFVRSQVNANGVEGLQINPNSAVFQFRKGANHTRL